MTTMTKPQVRSGRLPVAADLELAWETRGTGPDLIMINNFFMDLAHWRAATARLAGSHRVITYDLRNQGASGRSPQAGWDDHLGDLLALTEHLGAQRPYLLGTSDSTVLARDFAIRHPDRAGGVILVGPTFSPYGVRRVDQVTQSWIDALDRQGPAAFFEMSYPLVFGDKLIEEYGELGFRSRLMAFTTHVDPQELRAGLELVLASDRDPALLSRLACPTLLLNGDDDFCLGVQAAQEIARLLPDGRLVIMPGSGHLPYIDNTDRFEAEVAAFVAGGEAAAR